MALTDTLHMTANTKPLPSPSKTVSDLLTTAGSKVVASNVIDFLVAPAVSNGDILFIETGDNIGYYVIDTVAVHTLELYEELEFTDRAIVKAYVYSVFSKLNTQTVNVISDRSDRLLKLTRLHVDLSSRYFMGHTSDTAMPEVWYNSPPANRVVTDAVGVHAEGSLTAPLLTSLHDGDDLTISDGSNTVQFHIDESGTYVPLGGYDASNVRLDVSASVTPADVATVIDTAIGASALTITPTRTDALVELEAVGYGSAYNVLITEELAMSGSTFTPVGMSGGAQTAFDDVNGLAAVGQLVALPVNEIANGNNFTVSDGTNPLVRYYFNRTGTYSPVGGWSTERVEIDVSQVSTADEVAVLMREAIAGVAATGRVTCLDVSDLADGDMVGIGDGVTFANFWMDVSGTYVPGTGYNLTNIRVDLFGATDAEHVAQALREAIYGSTLTVSTNDLLTSSVTVQNDLVGMVGNVGITEHVVGGESFNPVGMSDGNGTPLLDVTVRGTGPYVTLVNDVNGVVGNVPIEANMTVGSLNAEGMTDGIDPWATNDMNGYLQADMLCGPAATAADYGRYSLVLDGTLVDPSVGTRVLVWFDLDSWDVESSFILGLSNGQVSPTLDGNDRFGVEFYRESDDEVRVRLEFGGVTGTTYMPVNGTAFVDRQYLVELEIVGSGGDRATCRVFEAPDVDTVLASVSVDKTAAVEYDRWSVSTEGSGAAVEGSGVDINVRYVDVEIGTGAVVDASGGIAVGYSKWRLFLDRYWVVLTAGDGAKTLVGNTADSLDLSVDEVLGFTLDTVAPVVLFNGIDFESTVEEGGYPKVSEKASYDQIEVSFVSDKSGTYYLKLDSTAFTNGLLITSGSCVGGAAKAVPMFTQDLTGAGARDGLHMFRVYVRDDAGNVGAAT